MGSHVASGNTSKSSTMLSNAPHILVVDEAPWGIRSLARTSAGAYLAAPRCIVFRDRTQAAYS